jgi:hypothetical protein
MRKRLESEAADKDESVAQVLLRHLQRSFNRDQQLERDPATRAFCFLIMELSERIRLGAGSSERWQRNPFVFRAFKLAVGTLLDRFEPKGSLRPPPFRSLLRQDKEYFDLHVDERSTIEEMAKIWETPERAADSAVYNTLLDLSGWQKAQAIKRYWADRASRNESLSEIAKHQIKEAERTWYGMTDVRRDLGLGKIEIKTDNRTKKNKKKRWPKTEWYRSEGL